jgi:cysteine dioxygenase
MLVLCWAPGQFSPIHDHAGSTCAVRVIRGTASETVYQQTEHEVLQQTSHWVAGDVFGGSDGDIHAVGNFAPDDTPLVTLHVYSPPLTRMSLYSLEDGRLVPQRSLISASTAAPVVIPTTSGACRHPVVVKV